ncbi:NAD-dependent epimerase/dehydratase family protein [Thermosipho sp. 1074]|uniref:NAD-dependent epimerase/dehydratase family protein n=1 Tax=Thermosipho sp. 1074 TaxID=1643331 RepID=UPI000987C2F9|nr:NAD-dependent epimerase/dehydratase family protein [Thermosipho sp. 1074]OOC44214.1 hypothetical protein XO08_04065 [Thermosipho sp. 1074]
MKKVLITGIAGFLGYHTAKQLINSGFYEVIGIDNLIDFGDRELKLNRLRNLDLGEKSFEFNKEYRSEKLVFRRLDLLDLDSLRNFLSKVEFDYVIHFASKAGVKYSFENPYYYFENNLKGFINLLELIKGRSIENVLFASSSSVYGDQGTEFNENMKCVPISPYGVSCLSLENLARVYNMKYGIPLISMRIFTVIGKYGRPDLGVNKIINKIKNDEAIDLYNYGENTRDIICIDDFTEVVFRLLNIKKEKFDIFNIGTGKDISMKDFVKIVEAQLNKTAKVNYINKIVGDIEKAKADISKLTLETKKTDFIDIEASIRKILF